MGFLDLFQGIGILGVLSWLLMNVFAGIIISLILTVLIWIPQIHKAVNRLGKYPQKNSKLLSANFIIGVSLFFTLIYIFNTLPPVFYEIPKNSINQSYLFQLENLNIHYKMYITQSSFSLPDIAFSLTMIFIPLFLVTLRLLLNNCRKEIQFSFFSLSKNEEKNPKILTQKEIEENLAFKAQIIGLYFSFIASTIAYLYFGISLTIFKYNDVALIPLFQSFIPDYDIPFLFILFVIEITIILLFTIFTEMLLESYEPIDQT
jgi:hypothetical protein